ncbi:MAG TPA: AAA family ATPase [Caulobacteraceae bacterium]|jgi:chloramphenicol 3-O phosphotransferase
MTKANIRGRAAGRPAASELPSVILLNGTSSAGKSSLTGALQARLSFIRMGIDDFIHQRAPVAWYGAPEGLFRAPRKGGGALLEYGSEALKLWRAYHRSVRVCVEEGLGVVVDDAIITRELLEDWVTALAGIDVFFVGVHCAAEELIQRELARRDRDLGSALANVERVHAHAIYDLEIDSTVTPSSALATQVISALESRSGPSAFERLRTALV